jgi:uncharacterized membrane protein
MKMLMAILMTCVLAAAVGCESPRGGGMSGGEGFNIGTPALDTRVVQGQTQSATVSLNRGELFKRDVTLDIRASKGISVEPTKTVVKASATQDVQLKITAAKDAALGDYKIYLKGTPDVGEATSTEFTVKVISQ